MKAVCAVLSFAAPALAQSALHVGPGQPFADIQAAIQAAARGDRVLVHAGTYSPFAVDKGLVVRAEPKGALVTISSALGGSVAATVPAGQHAIVQGLLVRHAVDVARPAGATAGGVLSLLDVDVLAGIRVTDAYLTMQAGFVSGGIGEGIVLLGTASLIATQCEIRGGHSGNLVFAPLLGIRADHQSRLQFSNCTVTGGSRGWVHSTFYGGTGVGMFGSARGSFVDCTLQAYQQASVPGGVGLDNQSSVAPVLERTVTKDRQGASPSVLGAVQNGLLLGVSTATPLARGSTFQLDFATRPGLPVIAHVSLQLDAPATYPFVAQPVFGFVQNSAQFAFALADGQGRAPVSFAIPNASWLKDLPLWFCAWSEQNLPVQLSPVLGGPID